MNRELKVGLIAILSIAVLVIGINYLKGLNVLSKHKHFHAKYENIGGLYPKFSLKIEVAVSISFTNSE